MSDRMNLITDARKVLGKSQFGHAFRDLLQFNQRQVGLFLAQDDLAPNRRALLVQRLLILDVVGALSNPGTLPPDREDDFGPILIAYDMQTGYQPAPAPVRDPPGANALRLGPYPRGCRDQTRAEIFRLHIERRTGGTIQNCRQCKYEARHRIDRHWEGRATQASASRRAIPAKRLQPLNPLHSAEV